MSNVGEIEIIWKDVNSFNDRFDFFAQSIEKRLQFRNAFQRSVWKTIPPAFSFNFSSTFILPIASLDLNSSEYANTFAKLRHDTRHGPRSTVLRRHDVQVSASIDRPVVLIKQMIREKWPSFFSRSDFFIVKSTMFPSFFARIIRTTLNKA